MKKIALAVATAAAIFTAAPLFVGAIPAQAEGLRMAQAPNIDVQIGRDRDDKSVRDRDEKADRDRRERADRDRRDKDKDKGLTVGIGPNGLELGQKQKCRTVTTTVETDSGRKEKRTERKCD
jgi:hypothetical protein